MPKLKFSFDRTISKDVDIHIDVSFQSMYIIQNILRSPETVRHSILCVEVRFRLYFVFV